MNKKSIILGSVLFASVATLGVGYAAISAQTLKVEGSATAQASSENFNVVFSGTPSVAVGSKGTTQSTIADDKKSATLTISDFTTTGDSTTITYTVENKSAELGAKVKASVATNSNEEYFNVSVTQSVDATAELAHGQTMTVTVTVSLKKTPTDTVNSTIKINIVATPVETN